MSNSTKLKNPAFLYANEVSQVCQGLFRRLNLNAFSYSKIYADGSRAELWSDLSALDHSFFIKSHISKVYTPNLFQNKKFILYDEAVRNFPKATQDRIQNQLKDQRELFNHANCLFLIEYAATFTEYFAFYTANSQENAVSSYLNNMDPLKKFIRYFKKRAKLLIVDAEKH